VLPLTEADQVMVRARQGAVPIGFGDKESPEQPVGRLLWFGPWQVLH
jgi:hypothetical protein